MGSCNQELARRMARGKVSLYASYSFLNSLCSLLACRLTFPRLILLAGFAGSWYPNKWACSQAKCYHGIHTNTSSDTEYLVTTREFSKAVYLQEKIFPCLITYDTGCHTLLTALLNSINLSTQRESGLNTKLDSRIPTNILIHGADTQSSVLDKVILTFSFP